MITESKTEWKWGAFAALAMAIIAFYPQFNLWLARGKQWQGSYVLVQGDEIAYSGYINALIDGRPRRNDPYIGKDDVPGASLSESLFSIQVIPAYAIAVPARIMHISASTAFILLIVFCAIASSLAIFWLLSEIVGDGLAAAATVLIVLCLGTLTAGQGEALFMLSGSNDYDFFPYLRRYQPSLAFPLFFVFCVCVYRSLAMAKTRKAIRWTISAALVLIVLVFSYFYMWTAALAWLACLAVVWLAARPSDWKQISINLGIIGVVALAAVAAFFSLLAHRSKSMDSTQLLSHSHAPDLFHAPEIVAYVVLAALVIALWRGFVGIKEPIVLLAASFALMPITVFNQQVITGLSLQPIHYQLFIANYVVLVGLVLAAVAIIKGRKPADWRLPRKVLFYAGALALAWGVVELAGSTKRNAPYARIRDDSMPAIARLAQIAREDGTYDRARATGSYPIVYSTNLDVAGSLSTGAPQGVLWAHHTPAAGVASLDQSKELFYYYLYYSGADERELAQAMAERRFQTLSALFGIERVAATLALDAKPITTEEMRAEVRHYANFIRSFSKELAAQPLLSFVVAPVQAEPNYANLDRWYERDAGERVGIYVIYRVKLRP
jgi:hypothetical protein